MIKIYIVYINGGFGDIKYFQKRENAEEYAKTVSNKNVEIAEEYATAKEWANTNFSDVYEDNF